MFKKLNKKLNTINTVATYRAMNRALAKTNTQFKRALRKELGVKSSDINKRFKQKKASTKKLSVSLGVGTKYGLSLSLFKPKIKIVKNSNTKKKYNGVSVKIGSKRELVPDAFIMNSRNGSLVVKRTTERKFPVKKVTYNIFDDAKKLQQQQQSFLKNEFKNEFSSQLKYLMK